MIAARTLLLLAVLAAGDVLKAESVSGNTSFEGCPAWLGEYVKWHATQRLNESAARVTWTDQVHGGGSMGYGDRIRSLVYTLRVAAATDRVFQAVMKESVNIERVFTPTLIDWRPPGQHGNLSAAAPGSFVANFLHGNRSSLEPVKEMFWMYNPYCSWPLPDFVPPGRSANVSENHLRLDWDCGCIFRALFRFSDELESRIDEEMNQIFPNGTKQIYSAVHVRTYGNLAGEEGSTNDRLPVNATAYQPLLALIECVRNRTGIYPIFLAISDVNARRAVKRGAFPGVYGPSSEWAYHPHADYTLREAPTGPSNMPPHGPENHVKTFVELGVLSRGTVGFWSRSGYSNLARWMQGARPEDGFGVEQGSGHCKSFREGGPGGV